MRWVLEGFRQTLKKLGVGPFDQEYYESEFYRHGKEVVESGLRQGVFIRNADGVVVAPLGLAIGLAIGAGILWMLVSVLAGEGSFRHLLSVVTYVGITTILLGVASLAVLMLGGGRVFWAH